ncbi:MAG: F0F1 ATP synthase subunit A [Proteobacteria bacterium]|nr:F0F1 ATP synthase subunit A [Pseudomonadota bacterium]
MTEEAASHAASAESSATELPSFLDFFGLNKHGEFLGIGYHDWVPILMSWLVAVVLVIVTLWATRKMEKIPRGAQAFMEIIVEGLDNFFTGIIGPAAARYLPLLGSLFLYILLMNLWGLIPLMHSPTNKLNTTLALATVVFVTTHYEGVRAKGLWGYFRHFLEPLMLAPLMFPIHIIGELARPLSLSLRLFGNLTGEDVAIVSLVVLSPLILGIIPIPFQVVMMILALLFSTVQAVVFTLLSSIYIGSAIGALEGEEHGH